MAAGLGGLEFLTELSLTKNYLNGAVPLSLGFAFPNLQNFDLSDNSLTGQLPSIFPKDLTNLNLGKNNLGGVISPGWSTLEKLTSLVLDTNSIGGSLPLELSHLIALKEIRLGENLINGMVCSRNYSSLITERLTS